MIFKVSIQHDNGIAVITTSAPTAEEAAKKVAKKEKAPLRAVIDVSDEDGPVFIETWNKRGRRSLSLEGKTTARIDRVVCHLEWEAKLSDPCKNGHPDFSLTGSHWPKGAKMRYGEPEGLCSGAIGDTIVKVLPELGVINRLHLCDFTGAPAHAVENGLYFLGQSPEAGAKYLRIDMDTARYLREKFVMAEPSSIAKVAMLKELHELGVVAQWKREAQEAIAFLEAKTRHQFLWAGEKTNLSHISLDSDTRELDTLSLEERIARAKNREFNKRLKQIEDKARAARMEAKMEKDLLRKLFPISSSNNYIFYPESKRLALNWVSHNLFSKEDVARVVAKVSEWTDANVGGNVVHAVVIGDSSNPKMVWNMGMGRVPIHKARQLVADALGE